jgi:hypothetical protein
MLVQSIARNYTIDEMGHTNQIITATPATPVGGLNGPAPFNPKSYPAATQPIKITDCIVTSTQITLRFQTGENAQYGVWSSNDLVNWTFLGVADQIADYYYSFAAPLGAASTVSYFQARKL